MSTEISHSDPQRPDLFWQAYRYVADELTTTERQEFDNVLAADQQAREAVAHVVELESLVLAAEGTMATFEGPRTAKLLPAATSGLNYWMQPIGWISVGAAACLAILMALQSFWPIDGAAMGSRSGSMVASSDSKTAHPGNVSNDELAGDQLAGDLALAWAHTSTQLPTPGAATVEIVDRDWTLQDHVEHDLAQVDGMAQLNDEPLSATPSWLLAAVADAQAASVEN